MVISRRRHLLRLDLKWMNHAGNLTDVDEEIQFYFFIYYLKTYQQFVRTNNVPTRVINGVRQSFWINGFLIFKKIFPAVIYDYAASR